MATGHQVFSIFHFGCPSSDKHHTNHSHSRNVVFSSSGSSKDSLGSFGSAVSFSFHHLTISPLAPRNNMLANHHFHCTPTTHWLRCPLPMPNTPACMCRVMHMPLLPLLQVVAYNKSPLAYDNDGIFKKRIGWVWKDIWKKMGCNTVVTSCKFKLGLIKLLSEAGLSAFSWVSHSQHACSLSSS